MTNDPADGPASLNEKGSSAPETLNGDWFRRMVAPALASHPPADRWEELREELTAGEPGPMRLASPGRDVRPSLRSPRLILTAAAAILVLATIGVTSWAIRTPQVGTGPGVTPTTPGPSTTTSAPFVDSDAVAPSQSPEDAERDGIAPALAQLPASQRVSIDAFIEVPEGTWVLSRTRGVAGPKGDGVLGAPSGAPRDGVFTPEYGEVLLLGKSGEIELAYPMAGWPPDWIYATPDAIFAGRIGDGGLPDTTILRIDRRSLILDGIVIPGPEPDDEGADGRAGWRDANPEEAEAFGQFGLVDYRPEALGTPTIGSGSIRIDLPAIEALFAEPPLPRPMARADLAHLIAQRDCMGRSGYAMSFAPEPDGGAAIITWGKDDEGRPTFSANFAACDAVGRAAEVRVRALGTR